MTSARTSHFNMALVAILSLIVCCAAIGPASAATKYTQGAPVFSATLDGTNEFSPGQDATLRILVTNTGLNALKQLNQGTIDSEDIPSTAKLVTAGLSSYNPEILPKTDPQMLGDIPGNGKPVAASFTVKITDNATAGEYQLPLTIKYRYTRPIQQEIGDTFQFTYNNATDTIPITIKIKPAVKVDVMNVTADPLIPGSEGFISLQIRNDGPENGRMATVKILRNGKSPIIPSDNSAFIGIFPSGAVSDTRFKVSVADDAQNKTYPLDIAVAYTNREGTQVTSRTTTIGIPVLAKPQIGIISPVPSLAQGSEQTIEIIYRNDGEVTLYDAQARLSAHEPITSTGNTAFLGSIRPGESATARFEVKASGNSETTAITLDSRIRYRDSLGISHESDTIPVTVSVVPGTSLVSGTLLLFIGVIAILGAGAVVWKYHRARTMR